MPKTRETRRIAAAAPGAAHAMPANVPGGSVGEQLGCVIAQVRRQRALGVRPNTMTLVPFGVLAALVAIANAVQALGADARDWER